jgi:hypothetical protein
MTRRRVDLPGRTVKLIEENALGKASGDLHGFAICAAGTKDHQGRMPKRAWLRTILQGVSSAVGAGSTLAGLVTEARNVAISLIEGGAMIAPCSGWGGVFEIIMSKRASSNKH